ncbi:MAG: PDZ domain-containing protein, partial [Acidobacteriota bacterium]|nr:PDZ domain-containing protein [Acidobacteriota bacterium]
MSRKFGIIAILIVVIGAVLGGILGKLPVKSTADVSLTSEKVVSDYREALDVIDKNYIGEVDHEKITESSIQSMLFTLDPHSSFFTRDEFRKLYEDQSSQFYGIGVSILQHRDGVYIQSIIPNTPADKAGLRYGDRFVQVEGKDATEWTSAEVSKNVRGPRGTP